MKEINSQLHAHQPSHVVSSRLPKLRLTNLHLNGWDELHGQVIKSAMTRQCMPWVETLARRYFDSGSLYDRARILAVAHLNGIYHIYYNCAGMFLSDDQKDRLNEHFLKMGKYHMIAREEAIKRGRNSWQVKPKAHYAQHLFEQSCAISSRHTQCYSQESQIGKVTKMWRGSCSGPYQKHVQYAMCIKHLLRFAIVFDL